MTPPQDPRIVEASWRFEQKRYRDAHALGMAVLQDDPKSAPAYAVLGRVAIALGTFDKGADCFQRAWAIDPENAAYGAGYARCMIGLNREPPAIAAAEMALVFGPRDAETFDSLGVIFSRAGRDETAARCFREAVALDPGNPALQLNLGRAEQRLGNLDAAEAAFRACLALEPSNDRAILALVQLRPQTLEQNFTQSLFKAFEAVAGHPEPMLRIGLALAKTFEDQDLPDLALDWMLMARLAKARGVADLEVWQAGVFQAAMATETAANPGGDPSEAPVLVFGMPGGEPEALASILSAHPQVGNAGDPFAFALTARRVAGSPTRDLIDGPTLDKARGADRARLGLEYVGELRARVPDAPRIVDGQPLNVLYAGHVHAALPNARMICIRRRPIDACLAVLRQPLTSDLRAHGWTYALETIARFWLDQDRLVAHWRATVPPDRFQVLDWDDVIADPDGQARALVSWLDLPWAESVGEAAGRAGLKPPRDWRAYGPKLRPLLTALQAGGALDPDEAAGL